MTIHDDEHMTAEEWRLQEERISLENAEQDELDHRFDRFREAAEQFMADAAAADTHSADVDPGRVDPWSER